ncbi:MAG: hypothetical protein DYH00_09220 [Bacteroidetes bacterium CHB6]|nr:hypothetical protein [Bacteroidetes bacterium CHB6]
MFDFLVLLNYSVCFNFGRGGIKKAERGLIPNARYRGSCKTHSASKKERPRFTQAFPLSPSCTVKFARFL